MTSVALNDVVVVHASDAGTWPSYLQSEVKTVTSSAGDVKCVRLAASTPQASLDLLLHGHVVIVLATPLLLDTLKTNDVTDPVDFRLAAGCVLLLCGTEREEFDPHLLARCFPEGQATPTYTHTQISDVITVVDTLREQARNTLLFDVIPSTVFCEHPTMVTVSFRNVDIEERCFSVTVADVDCGLTLPVNRLTQCFTAPAGLVGDVMVRLREGNVVIGCRRLTYVSDTSRDGLHQVALELLDVQSELLVEAGLKAGRLDEAVEKILAEDRPALYQGLFSRFVNGKSQYDEELPSLLHWCAKYGLTKVNCRLLKLPNADLATCVTNSQGHSPANLAKIKRNSDIARIIEQKQNDEERYTEMYLRIRSMLSDDDLQSMDHYYNMGNSLYSTYGDLSEGYLTMDRIARERLLREYEEVYTTPNDGDRTPVTMATAPSPEEPSDIFRWTPQEKEEKLKDSMAPHLRELISIIEGVKGQERTIDEAEKLFHSWQNQYEPQPEHGVVKQKHRPPVKPLHNGEAEVDSRPGLFKKIQGVLWRPHNRAAMPPSQAPSSPSVAAAARAGLALTSPMSPAAPLTVTPPSPAKPKANAQSHTNGPPPIPPRVPISNHSSNTRANPTVPTKRK